MENYSFRQDIGCDNEALPGVLGNRGKRTLIKWEQRPILRGTKTILGNREHKKASFQFLGSRGTSQFISGNKETGTPSFPPQGEPKQLRVVGGTAGPAMAGPLFLAKKCFSQTT